MSVMGNRWGFALLVAAFVGMSRFTDFQTQLGAPPGSIADRLSIFTANGVFEMSENRYRLTEKGRALFPVSGDRAAMGAAVVSGTRGAGGAPHPHGVRRPIRSGPDVRSVLSAATGRARPAGAPNLSLRSTFRRKLEQKFSFENRPKSAEKFLALSP